MKINKKNSMYLYRCLKKLKNKGKALNYYWTSLNRNYKYEKSKYEQSDKRAWIYYDSKTTYRMLMCGQSNSWNKWEIKMWVEAIYKQLKERMKVEILNYIPPLLGSRHFPELERKFCRKKANNFAVLIREKNRLDVFETSKLLKRRTERS